MSAKLPDHLQELVNEIPRGYPLEKYVFIDSIGLSIAVRDRNKPESQQRKYGYWLTDTGDKVNVTFYDVRGSPREVILTGTCAAWGTQPRIIGRDTEVARQHFKVWYGVNSGFGSVGGPKVQQIIKDLQEPAWVPVVRGGGSYDTWIKEHGSRSKKNAMQDQGKSLGGKV